MIALHGKWVIAVASSVLLVIGVVVQAQPLTLPLDQRPAWLSRDGIVMAGSWEPLLFRVRRDGSDGYTPTPEQRAAYQREHSPEMVAQLKALGVNFVMIHCYKAFGLDAERESMADAVRFAKLCHDAGLRVGVYNNSGTIGWELFDKEVPQARDWLVLDPAGKPIPYGSTKYRYYWNRNHPDAQAFYRNIVRFAVNEIHADLLHFDNYLIGPGSDAVSVQRFRHYLSDSFPPAQREKMGIGTIDGVQPPMTGPPDTVLRRAWLDFSCRSLAESYYDLTRYARSLRPDILTECNPGGPRECIHPPIDHGRLIQGGEAFWDEGEHPGYRDGRLYTRIRTYKIGRRMDNVAFAYATTPLEMAESMAFNLDSLGCICWFEYGKIVAMPGSKNPISPELEPFIRFFNTRRDLLREAAVVADVAVLRSFPSQVFAGPRYGQLTAHIEQALIEGRVPFQILCDHQLDDLNRYRALVLAGCVALSDQQVERVRRYVRSGGRLCVIGPAATHDEWMTLRPKASLDDLPAGQVVRADEGDDPLAAIRKACGEKLTMSVDAGPGVCAELTTKADRRFVHLVNYHPNDPVENVKVHLLLPGNKRVRSVTFASPDRQQDAELAFQERPGEVRFTMPRMNLYGIAVVSME